MIGTFEAWERSRSARGVEPSSRSAVRIGHSPAPRPRQAGHRCPAAGRNGPADQVDCGAGADRHGQRGCASSSGSEPRPTQNRKSPRTLRPARIPIYGCPLSLRLRGYLVHVSAASAHSCIQVPFEGAIDTCFWRIVSHRERATDSTKAVGPDVLASRILQPKV